MKKGVTITLITLAILLTAGYIYWQFIKKGFIKNAVEKLYPNKPIVFM